MKPLPLFLRSLVAVTLMFFYASGFSQQDTLHLYYHHTAVEPHDTTLAKMDKWIKGLNGVHQDLRIVGYYHKGDFRKFAQQRVDEMFLVVNRKARPLFTIKSMETKKGEDYQRTTVDLIYAPTGGDKPVAKEQKKDVKKEEVKEDKKEEKKDEVAAEGKDDKKSRKEEKSSKADKDDEKVKGDKSEKENEKAKDPEKEEKPEKKKAEKKVKPLDTEHYIYDSVWVNGKLKVTKKKKK